jgi:hypothetical protein
MRQEAWDKRHDVFWADVEEVVDPTKGCKQYLGLFFFRIYE